MLGIIALYVALHFANVWIAVLMFIICIPILIVMGYYNVHHISKVRDRLNVKFGTHYGIQQFDYTKRTAELLEEINKKLK
jgi:membrane protein implicated in regulation of membrane protease activity